MGLSSLDLQQCRRRLAGQLVQQLLLCLRCRGVVGASRLSVKQVQRNSFAVDRREFFSEPFGQGMNVWQFLRHQFAVCIVGGKERIDGGKGSLNRLLAGDDDGIRTGSYAAAGEKGSGAQCEHQPDQDQGSSGPATLA